MKHHQGVQETALVMRDKGVKVATEAASDSDIYASYCDGLTRFAASLVGRDEAGDVVADVIVRVLSRRHLTDLDEPKPYLYKAVLNESRSHLRRRKGVVTTPHDGLADNPAPIADPEVLDAVMALPAQQRAAAFLVYWEGYSTTEAAALMGIRVGTIGRYLHLARQRLKRVLDED